jgi:hypothetical protein
VQIFVINTNTVLILIDQGTKVQAVDRLKDIRGSTFGTIAAEVSGYDENFLFGGHDAWSSATSSNGCTKKTDRLYSRGHSCKQNTLYPVG